MKKICNICREKKDINDFYTSRSCKDGIMTCCKKCHSLNTKTKISKDTKLKQKLYSIKEIIDDIIIIIEKDKDTNEQLKNIIKNL